MKKAKTGNISLKILLFTAAFATVLCLAVLGRGPYRDAVSAYAADDISSLIETSGTIPEETTGPDAGSPDETTTTEPAETTTEPVTMPVVLKTSKTVVGIKVGKTYDLKPLISGADGTLRYSTDSADTATVSKYGIVTGRKAGRAVITVSDKKSSVTITVKVTRIPPASVKLKKTALTMTVGKTFKLTATVYPKDATIRDVRYSSSNKTIAKVSADGTITAIKKGRAVITVTAKGNKAVTAKCVVTVKPVLASKIKLSRTALTLYKGRTKTLTAKVYPDNAENKSVRWTSSNTSVVKVSSTGKITALKKGKAAVTVTSKGNKAVTAKCVVTVKNVPVSSIKLSKTSLSLIYSHTYKLTASVRPSDAYKKSVTWKSSKPSVAKISSSGLITACGKGKTVITCTATDGSGKKATCTVTVTKPAVITVDPYTSNWELLCVRRDRKLPENYVPKLDEIFSTGYSMDYRVTPHYEAMYRDAAREGVYLTPYSGYRRYETQKNNYENLIRSYMYSYGYSYSTAADAAARVILPPGTSEHNYGFAMDICSTESAFQYSAAYAWLQKHAQDYGFIMRYPYDKQSITQIIYEPWHWRYVGVENAKKIKASGLCLEEWLTANGYIW